MMEWPSHKWAKSLMIAIMLVLLNPAIWWWCCLRAACMTYTSCILLYCLVLPVIFSRCRASPVAWGGKELCRLEKYVKYTHRHSTQIKWWNMGRRTQKNKMKTTKLDSWKDCCHIPIILRLNLFWRLFNHHWVLVFFSSPLKSLKPVFSYIFKLVTLI